MKYATPSSQRIKLNLWVTSSISNQTPLTANVFCSSEFEGFFSRWSNIKVALWVWLVCLEAAAVLTCGINLSFYGHTSATTEGLSLVQTFPQDGQPKYVFTPFLNILLPSRRTALLLVAGVCKSVILCMKCLNSLCCSKRPVPNKPTLKKVAQLCNSLSFVNFWLLEGGGARGSTRRSNYNFKGGAEFVVAPSLSSAFDANRNSEEAKLRRSSVVFLHTGRALLWLNARCE